MEMATKDEFIKAIRKSIKYLDHFNKERNDDPARYYDDKYAEPIINYFKEHKVVSYETNRNKRWKCTPICSLVSSGRLCYIDFIKEEGVIFEKPVKNDLNDSHPTKMDAVIGLKYYECKCQEPTSKSHGGLRTTYKNSELFKEFGVKNYQSDLEEAEDEDGKKSKYDVFKFNVDELNIQLDGNPDYRKLRFDLKQLICHLIAIANEKKDNYASLQYVFYTPSKEVIEKEGYKNVKKMYKELNDEIEAIWKENTTIRKFCKDKNIDLEKPLFKEVNEIEDTNYLIAFKK